jgi:hypothetical protein
MYAARQPNDRAAARLHICGIRIEEVSMTPMLMHWPAHDLGEITKADGLHITSFCEDGVTYGTPTWIWSVAVDGELYVRAYNGKKSRWYQVAMRQRAGRIMAAGIICDVRFGPVDGSVNDRIDDAYRAKYGGSSYLNAMITERARAATIRITPRNRS